MTHKGKIAVCIVFGRLDYRERRLLSVEPLAAMFKNLPFYRTEFEKREIDKRTDERRGSIL